MPPKDPARRDRIIDAALDVIAADGVRGATHRRIAAHANVPLGSMTYYFTSIDELLDEAFRRFADETVADLTSSLAAASTQVAAREALVKLIHSNLAGPAAQRFHVLNFELFALAARDSRYR